MRKSSSRISYFLSQPHQPFFALGVISAIIFMLVFLLSFKGIVVLNTTPNTLHAYSMLFIVFTPFFQGFLLTTYPRFNQFPPLEQKIYTTNFTLLFVGAILFLIGLFIWIGFLYIGMFLLFCNQLYTLFVFYQIYKVSISPQKYDQFWILLSFASGVVSNLIFIIALIVDSSMMQELAKKSGVYLYLIFVALSVGQRMIPFFSHVSVDKNTKILKIVYILFILGVLTDISPFAYGFVFYYIAGIFLAKEIYRWKLPFKKAEPILWILHLAIFWLPAGLLIGSIVDMAAVIMNKDFIFAGLHLVALGFITTVLIGFGTRVTLGHSGNLMIIDNLTKALFYMTQIVVYMRLLYSLTQTGFLFDITAALWIALFVAWSFKYMPILLFGKKITP